VEAATKDTAEAGMEVVVAPDTAAEAHGMEAEEALGTAVEANGMAATGTEAAPASSLASAPPITDMATRHGGIATRVTMTTATTMTTFPGITITSQLTPFPGPTMRCLRPRTRTV